MGDRPAPQLRRYVAGVAGIGGVALAASLAWLPGGTPEWSTVIGLWVAAVLGAGVPLRFQRRGETQAFTLEEGVYVAMLFVVPLNLVPLAIVTAGIVGQATASRDLVKQAFNAGQMATWAAISTAVFAVVGAGPEVLHPRSVLATVLAVVMVNAVNVLLMAELFRRLHGASYRTVIADTLPIDTVTAIGNTAFGLLLAFVIGENPWAAILASTMMVGLFLGYRGYARVLGERQRTEALHDLTRSLVASFASPAAADDFRAGLCRLFGGGSAELRLIAVDRASASEAEPLSTAIQHVVARGIAVHSSDPSIAGGHRDVIAAPVIYEGRTLGALAVYDRHGLEPWDESDATLLATLANEAALALKNVELFSQVERERARWEAESTKLGDIVDAASDGIAMFAADGTVEAWNAAMEELTGLSSTHALGQPWFIVLRLRDAEDREVAVDGDHVLNQALGGRRQAEPVGLQVLRRDGSWRWINATFAPIHREDAAAAGTVMVARDVTREREVDDLKADFVATVSHELRTPLTPLKGFLATLEARREELDDEQRTAIHEAMSSQLSRLERLVSDLLVVADLDRGAVRLEREPVDLVAAVRLAVEREAVGSHDRVSVHRPEQATMAIADGMAVVQIIRALLSNALKHTDGAIEVAISRDGGHALVTVRDFGPGIPSWEQARIFRRFHRLGDHLQRTQGPGLGLPIAQALADRLGGDIEVTSEVGRGSAFALRLPGVRPRLVEDSIKVG